MIISQLLHIRSLKIRCLEVELWAKQKLKPKFSCTPFNSFYLPSWKFWVEVQVNIWLTNYYLGWITLHYFRAEQNKIIPLPNDFLYKIFSLAIVILGCFYIKLKNWLYVFYFLLLTTLMIAIRLFPFPIFFDQFQRFTVKQAGTCISCKDLSVYK